jgi:hypothetical protein
MNGEESSKIDLSGIGKDEVKFIEKRVRISKGYEGMLSMFVNCINRASLGKGLDRHAECPNQKWEEQPICKITRKVGHGFTRGQMYKKFLELNRLEGVAIFNELMDICNYANADLIVLLEELRMYGWQLGPEGLMKEKDTKI